MLLYAKHGNFQEKIVESTQGFGNRMDLVRIASFQLVNYETLDKLLP